MNSLIKKICKYINPKNLIVYISVTILSAVILFFWGGYARSDAEFFYGLFDVSSAKVLSVDSIDKTEAEGFTSTIAIFSARVLSGEHKGEIVKVYQEHNTTIPIMKLVEPGDKIVIRSSMISDLGVEWTVDNYLRMPTLQWLVLLFVAFIVIFGRAKGLRTVISLAYTCIAVFIVFVPSVLSGQNAYINSVLVCIFIITMTLLLVSGLDKKTLCAALGCIGGVLAAAVITLIFSKIMKFTGYTSENSYQLTMLPNPVDLNAIAFSAVIIGAVGAVMDVAMSMSSSLYELSVKVPDITFGSIVSSGFAIGQDMMGTMANTLVLAYVGSSLSTVLLLLTFADSPADIFNREMIAFEVLQASAGSIGIILAIPITAFVCGALYTKNRTILRGKK